MAWFVFERRHENYTATELEEFPLLEAALKFGIHDLMLRSREDSKCSIGVGEAKGDDVHWYGEFRLDAHGRPTWTRGGPRRTATVVETLH
jgi:hypothetical protein